jgi:hypothetical protein
MTLMTIKINDPQDDISDRDTRLAFPFIYLRWLFAKFTVINYQLRSLIA